MYSDFRAHPLSDHHFLYSGFLPDNLLQELVFEDLWSLHPQDYHIISMHGKEVATPRWQQAYGKSYQYTGRVNQAFPIPSEFKKLHTWCQENIDARLNGLLLNWYDGLKGHYKCPNINNYT